MDAGAVSAALFVAKESGAITYLLGTLSNAFWSLKPSDDPTEQINKIKFRIHQLAPRITLEFARKLSWECSDLSDAYESFRFLTKQLDEQSIIIRDQMAEVERIICEYKRPWYKRPYYGVTSWFSLSHHHLNVEANILIIQEAASSFMMAFEKLTQWFPNFISLHKYQHHHPKKVALTTLNETLEGEALKD
jgi:hypothetical protein